VEVPGDALGLVTHTVRCKEEFLCQDFLFSS
jgi:hypothetical protein